MMPSDPVAVDLFRRKHPRFLDQTIKWRIRRMSAIARRGAV